MSHFFTLVLLEDNDEGIEEQVADLLAPYDENIEVAPYERRCSCIGRAARSAARTQAEEEFGTMEELKASFRESYPGFVDAPFNDKESTIAWRAHITPLLRRERELFEARSDKDKPDPTCGFYSGPRKHWWPEDAKEGDRYDDESGCGGTGTYISTYSPESKWDYWSIGGRWTGELDSDYDPYSDPRNIISCHLCSGTGDRPGWVHYNVLYKTNGDDRMMFQQSKSPEEAVGRIRDILREEGIPERSLPELSEMSVNRCFKDDWAKECNGCNSCKGTGKTVKWSLAPFEGDAMPVRRLPEDITPFALVTPDGEWHERGRMGWWACVSDEKEKSAWEIEVKEILSAHQDCLAVVCDLHI